MQKAPRKSSQNDGCPWRMKLHIGDRVQWVETGQRGTIKRIFADGYVSLVFDDGQPAELESANLKKIEKEK